MVNQLIFVHSLKKWRYAAVFLSTLPLIMLASCASNPSPEPTIITGNDHAVHGKAEEGEGAAHNVANPPETVAVRTADVEGGISSKSLEDGSEEYENSYAKESEAGTSADYNVSSRAERLRLFPANSDFNRYLHDFWDYALAQGVRDTTLAHLLPSLRYNDRVIKLDRSQPGGPVNTPPPPVTPYLRKHVNIARINGGKAKARELSSILRSISAKTGVPGSIIMAIYGHETSYGRITGNFDVANVVATLAFDGRRRELFERELLAIAQMVEDGVPRERLKGSWAGAMGLPQFLPSVYLRLARDGDGDGFADIWGNEADAMHSIAHYLVDAGWRAGIGWGGVARVPTNFNRKAVARLEEPQRCVRVIRRHSRWMSIGEWKRLGVRPLGNYGMDDNALATLLEPDGIGKKAYLLTENYRAILKYNCSNFYALSVGLLADAIKS